MYITAQMNLLTQKLKHFKNSHRISCQKCVTLLQLLDVAEGHKQEIIFRGKKCGRLLQWSSGCLLRGQNAHGNVKKQGLGLVSCRRSTQSKKQPLLQEFLLSSIHNGHQGKWKKENLEWDEATKVQLISSPPLGRPKLCGCFKLRWWVRKRLMIC